MPSDALYLTVWLSHTAAGTKIKAYFSPVRGFLHRCIASAWLEVLCGWSALHHSFAGATCMPGAQWWFFGSSCRIWHWVWILIRPGMQREGALFWLSYSTGWQKHLVQHPEGRSHLSVGQTVPVTGRETTASIQSCGDCSWWRVLVKEQRLASRGGRGSTIQTLSQIVGAFSSRTVQGIVKKWPLQSPVKQALTCNTIIY